MAPMATAATATKVLAVVLLVVAVLPPGALCSRGAGATVHRGGGHGHKHSPPSSPPPAAAPPPPAAAAAALVRATCNSTAYYALCVSALAADPSSATADVRGLSAIAVSAAAANATAGAATAAALANGTAAAQTPSQTAAADGTVQALLRTCAAKYGAAGDALAAARAAIAAQDYEYASVHVSAAGEYPEVCRALFRRQRPGAYPAELAAREEALRQLCAVALDIIALLSNGSS
ncbi:hypothetical protein ACP4OV_018338 [Aristida adscensionis]